jgi:predicted esterase YcpF (UPF0227 family)
VSNQNTFFIREKVLLLKMGERIYFGCWNACKKDASPFLESPDEGRWRPYMATEACTSNDIGFVVGISMGGWLASHVGVKCGIPFVALNPAISPSDSLQKHVGITVNYTGTDRTIDVDTVKQYPPLATTGCGLVFCEEGDEVIDPKATINTLSKHYEVHLIPGGSHRFESLDAQIALIERHVLSAGSA